MKGVSMSNTMRAQRPEGWVVFAAVVLMTSGVMRVLDALWAFDKNDESSEEL